MNAIDVVFRHNDLIPEQLVGKVAIVIDVLRATSVMITALANGATEIHTTGAINDALEQKRLNPKLLLAGERNALKLPGFDLGNSPLEMTRERVERRQLLMCTSNGTQAIKAVAKADKVIAAAFINLAAVIEYIAPLHQDIIVVCSGTNGHFSLDDGMVAGVLVNRLMDRKTFRLNDAALAMSLAIKEELQIKRTLKDCHHLKVLLKNGFQRDVDYCLTLDLLDLVPRMIAGRFVL